MDIRKNEQHRSQDLSQEGSSDGGGQQNELHSFSSSPSSSSSSSERKFIIGRVIVLMLIEFAIYSVNFVLIHSMFERPPKKTNMYSSFFFCLR